MSVIRVACVSGAIVLWMFGAHTTHVEAVALPYAASTVISQITESLTAKIVHNIFVLH